VGRIGLGVVALLGFAIVGCAGDDEYSCYDKYPNGAPKDPWQPPRHMEYDDDLSIDTLACAHVEYDVVCIGQDMCYCHNRTNTNYVTTSIACEDAHCGSFDEATCLSRPDCFVARHASSNIFIGCFTPDSIEDWPIPCDMRVSAKECSRGAECVGLYARNTDPSYGFVSCIAE
jgi:hypothetical protein